MIWSSKLMVSSLSSWSSSKCNTHRMILLWAGCKQPLCTLVVPGRNSRTQYNTRNFFRIPCGTMKKNLNFPSYANMKWYIWQWENTLIHALLHNRKLRIKHWLNHWSYDSIKSFHFVNLTLVRQSFLIISLQGNAEKNSRDITFNDV
jgi:hypothetical protein